MTDSQTLDIPQESAAAPAEPAPQPIPRILGILSRRPALTLALLGLLLWLPGIVSLPALDRDESRFAQSSRQMVETGNLVDIRFGHVPRYKKPVGIYWLQAASTVLAGRGDDSHIWTYRLPSLVGAISAAWLTVWCASAIWNAETAFLAGLVLLSTILLGAEAMIATTDAVLLACVVAVQAVLLRIYHAAHDPKARKSSFGLVMLGWIAFGLGVLVKGPVILGVAVATIIALAIWDREWRWLGGLRPVPGFIVFVLIVMPWLVAITIQTRGMYLDQSLGNDFAAKLAGGQESHGAPPGYYLLLSTITFWPAILFAAPAIGLGIAQRQQPGLRFLLAWALSWWIVVEAIPTKLPHYILSSYPALSILAALFVLQPQAKPGLSPGWFSFARWIGVVQFTLGLGGIIAALILLPQLYGNGRTAIMTALVCAGALVGLIALVLSLRRSHVWAVTASLLAMLIFVPTATAVVAPRLDELWISKRLKPLVAAAAQPGDPPPALAGYEEPSLVFALGSDVLLSDGRGAANAGAKSGGLALVEDSEKGAFLARLAELQADATALTSLSGFNYSRGRYVHITIYRVAQLHDVQ